MLKTLFLMIECLKHKQQTIGNNGILKLNHNGDNNGQNYMFPEI